MVGCRLLIIWLGPVFTNRTPSTIPGPKAANHMPTGQLKVAVGVKPHGWNSLSVDRFELLVDRHHGVKSRQMNNVSKRCQGPRSAEACPGGYKTLDFRGFSHSVRVL